MLLYSNKLVEYMNKTDQLRWFRERRGVAAILTIAVSTITIAGFG